jgi:hypothetical protein
MQGVEIQTTDEGNFVKKLREKGINWFVNNVFATFNVKCQLMLMLKVHISLKNLKKR